MHIIKQHLFWLGGHNICFVLWPHHLGKQLRFSPNKCEWTQTYVYIYKRIICLFCT